MKFFIVVLALVVNSWAADWIPHEIDKTGRSNSVLAADYDGDGKMEIISSTTQEVWVRSGDNHEVKHIIAKLDKRHRKECMHSCLMDVDNDGDLDFIGSSKEIFWLECPDEPLKQEWKMRTVSNELMGTHCLIAYDVDKDGREELVANSFVNKGKYPNSICWLKPGVNKDSKWSIYPLADKDAPGGTHYFACADLNGDGNADLVTGAKGMQFKNGDYFAAWYSGDDPKKPWRKQMIADKQLFATNIMPAFVDKDSHIDLIATRGHGKGVLWFRGPDWKPMEVDGGMKEPHSLDVADIDGDGDTDFATCGFGSKVVAWYENDGSGNFTKHVIARDQESYDLRLIDVDGDNDLDIINAGRATGNVIWFENKIPR